MSFALAVKVVVSVTHPPPGVPVGTLPIDIEPLEENPAPALVTLTHLMAPVASEARFWILDICTEAVIPVKPVVDVQYWMKFWP